VIAAFVWLEVTEELATPWQTPATVRYRIMAVGARADRGRGCYAAFVVHSDSYRIKAHAEVERRASPSPASSMRGHSFTRAPLIFSAPA